MNQTRKISLIEACINTAVGWFVSLALWYVVVVPILGIAPRADQAVGITTIFTAASIARGYLVRRFFETRFHALAERLAGRGKNKYEWSWSLPDEPPEYFESGKPIFPYGYFGKQTLFGEKFRPLTLDEKLKVDEERRARGLDVNERRVPPCD